MQEYGLQASPAGGLDDAIDRTLKLIAGRAKRKEISASTKKQYESCAEPVRKAFIRFAPNQVKPTHVAQYMDHLANTPNMANRQLTFMRMVFDNCIRWGLCDSNPCSSIKRHPENKRDRYITDQEYQAIRNAGATRLGLVMDVCYLTGQRISDILQLTRRDIREEGVYFKTGKTGKRLLVEMTATESLPGTWQAVITKRGLNMRLSARSVPHDHSN